MKAKYTLYSLLMFLPLIITAIALPFFPDQVPMHYDINGVIDRWGSKYEQLILPVIVIIFGAVLYVITRFAVKKEKGKPNEKASIIAGIGSLFVFNAMTYIFLYKAYFSSVNKAEPVDFDMNQVIFIAIGISLLIIGNIMPKIKYNSVIGLRTSWSMANERTWYLSQRFGGYSFIISGLAIIIGNLFFEGIACFIFTMVILSVDLVVSIIGSYLIYKKDQQTNG